MYQPSKDKLYGESSIDLYINVIEAYLFVSRTEFKSGAFENIAENDVIVKMGSIALKLGKFAFASVTVGYNQA